MDTPPHCIPWTSITPVGTEWMPSKHLFGNRSQVTLKSHLAQITATYPLHLSQETEGVV